ncbi:MAG: hypothetical protein WA140_07470 [Geobacteraceae bacterium]
MFRCTVMALLLIACSSVGAMEMRRPMNAQWLAYHFDGNAFRSGKGARGATVYLKEGYLPLFGAVGGNEAKLPEGKGVIAGICYLQTAGGKLKQGDAYIPLQNVPVEIIGASWRQTVRTTASGFFVVVPPPGDYEARLPGAIGKIGVERGKTSLLAVRGGKRMVD